MLRSLAYWCINFKKHLKTHQVASVLKVTQSLGQHKTAQQYKTSACTCIWVYNQSECYNAQLLRYNGNSGVMSSDKTSGCYTPPFLEPDRGFPSPSGFSLLRLLIHLPNSRIPSSTVSISSLLWFSIYWIYLGYRNISCCQWRNNWSSRLERIFTIWYCVIP